MPITSKPQLPYEDKLPRINPPESVAGRAASRKGCVDFLDYLELCYNVQGDGINITLKLKVFGSEISLGECNLTLANPSCTLGGGALGFKAEVTSTFHLADLSLHIKGTACAPFAGCTDGETTIQL